MKQMGTQWSKKHYPTIEGHRADFNGAVIERMAGRYTDAGFSAHPNRGSAGLMKIRPILMHARSIAGILAGRKTQTRRIVKLELSPKEHTAWLRGDGLWQWMTGIVNHEANTARCPFGFAGDGLWVRETWQPIRMQTAKERAKVTAILKRFQAGKVKDIVGEAMAMGAVGRSGKIKYLYAADFGDWAYDPDSDLRPWKPSIHMPRAASRLSLEVANIRVQRVQDISADDVIAEGVEIPVSAKGSPLLCISDAVENHKLWDDPKKATAYDWLSGYFALLWEQTNGKGSWARNDWVWVVDFKRIQS
jgi:hypothetical protein